MGRVATSIIGEYRLGRFARPSATFPRGQWCAIWDEPGAGEGAVRRRYGLAVGLDRPEDEARAALALFARSRDGAKLADGHVTIATLMAAYIEDRRREGKQVDVMRHNWKALARTFANLQPADLSLPVEVEGEMRTVAHRYAREREQAGIARDTILTELRRLRTCLNWAVDRGHIARAPHVWLPAQGAPRDHQLSESEVFRLIDAAGMPHVRLFLILALATTARKSAITELTWDRVDFERGTIDFRTTVKVRSILDSGHQKARAVVPMNNLLRAALQEARDGARTGFVVEWNGKPAGNVKKAVQRAVQRAGLTGRYIGSHALRHAMATWLAEDDLPMTAIQRLLGHEQISTTETTYAKATAANRKDVAEAVERRMERGLRLVR